MWPPIDGFKKWQELQHRENWSLSFGKDGSLGFKKSKSKAMAEEEIIEREEEDEGAAAGN